jgi:hypothetical protein
VEHGLNPDNRIKVALSGSEKLLGGFIKIETPQIA